MAKIKGADYQYLREHILSVLNRHPEAVTEYRYEGATPRRFRWDLFRATKVRIGDGAGLDGNITVPNCKDEHIDTALRSIVKEFSSWAAAK